MATKKITIELTEDQLKMVTGVFSVSWQGDDEELQEILEILIEAGGESWPFTDGKAREVQKAFSANWQPLTPQPSKN